MISPSQSTGQTIGNEKPINVGVFDDIIQEAKEKASTLQRNDFSKLSKFYRAQAQVKQSFLDELKAESSGQRQNLRNNPSMFNVNRTESMQVQGNISDQFQKANLIIRNLFK